MGWTRNWDNLVLALTTITGSTSSSAPSNYDPPIMVRRTDGAYKNVGGQSVFTGSTPFAQLCPAKMRFSDSINTGGSTYEYAQLFLGEGTTAENYEDYTMASPIANSGWDVLTNTTIETASTLDTGTGKIKGGITKVIFQYTGSDPVTVSEYGIALPIISSGGSYVECLVYRKVLDEAITVEQYDRLELEFTYPDIMPNQQYPT